MHKEENEQTLKTYRLKPVYTPLAKKTATTSTPNEPSTAGGQPSIDDAASSDKALSEANRMDADKAHAIADSTNTTASRSTAPSARVLRAANEDDDLYDPYSDYHDGTLRAVEFERDPWR